MTVEQIRDINRRRLARWGDILTERHATPAILIGVAHDDASGEPQVLIPDEMSLDLAAEFLERVGQQLLDMRDVKVIKRKA